MHAPHPAPDREDRHQDRAAARAGGRRWRVVARLQEEILRTLGRALTIRQVDAGSCNGCELEIHALGNPYYNIEGLGIRFVASPRHADMLLVTGPVSKHMAIALQAHLRRDARAEARRRRRRLRLHRRHLRRELREPRPRRQRDSGRCRDSRLPADADGAAAGHPRRPRRACARTGREREAARPKREQALERVAPRVVQ